MFEILLLFAVCFGRDNEPETRSVKSGRITPEVAASRRNGHDKLFAWTLLS